eukprot:Platyproteum_vivax@DN4997_c0_g1_i1.p1
MTEVSWANSQWSQYLKEAGISLDNYDNVTPPSNLYSLSNQKTVLVESGALSCFEQLLWELKISKKQPQFKHSGPIMLALFLLGGYLFRRKSRMKTISGLGLLLYTTPHVSQLTLSSIVTHMWKETAKVFVQYKLCSRAVLRLVQDLQIMHKQNPIHSSKKNTLFMHLVNLQNVHQKMCIETLLFFGIVIQEEPLVKSDHLEVGKMRQGHINVVNATMGQFSNLTSRMLVLLESLRSGCTYEETPTLSQKDSSKDSNFEVKPPSQRLSGTESMADILEADEEDDSKDYYPEREKSILDRFDVTAADRSLINDSFNKETVITTQKLLEKFKSIMGWLGLRSMVHASSFYQAMWVNMELVRQIHSLIMLKGQLEKMLQVLRTAMVTAFLQHEGIPEVLSTTPVEPKAVTLSKLLEKCQTSCRVAFARFVEASQVAAASEPYQASQVVGKFESGEQVWQSVVSPPMWANLITNPDQSNSIILANTINAAENVQSSCEQLVNAYNVYQGCLPPPIVEEKVVEVVKEEAVAIGPQLPTSWTEVLEATGGEVEVEEEEEKEQGKKKRSRVSKSKEDDIIAQSNRTMQELQNVLELNKLKEKAKTERVLRKELDSTGHVTAVWEKGIVENSSEIKMETPAVSSSIGAAAKSLDKEPNVGEKYGEPGGFNATSKIQLMKDVEEIFAKRQEKLEREKMEKKKKKKKKKSTLR